MKKFYSFLFAAVALVGFAACNSDSTEEPAPAQQVGKMEFTANIGEDTKTSLNGTKVKWCAEDAIAVSDGTKVEMYKVKELLNDGKSAIFQGAALEGNTFYAVYPYAEDAAYTDGKWNVTIPTEQVAVAGSFADGAALAYGEYQGDYTFSFTNENAVLKFQVPENCSFVEFYNGEDLAVELNGGLTAGKDYYAVVAPETSYTFTVRIDGYLSKQGTKALDLEKNKIYNLGILPAPKTSGYNVVGSFQGWDVAVGKAVVMYADVDGWAVAKGVELYKTDEFKIVKGNSWTTSYGFNAVGVLPLGEEKAVVDSNSQNMKAATNGKFDISFNATAKKIKYTCVEEYTGTVEITINNKANWSPLYITLKDGATVIADNQTVTGNKFAVSMDYIGSSLSYTLSNGSKTMEGNVTIAKNGATINLEETVIKLKVQLNTANAKQWWGNKMCIHAWETNTTLDSPGWPGLVMTKEANYTWSIQIPSELAGKTIKCIINNGGDWKSYDPTNISIKAEGDTIVTGSSIGIN